MKVNEQEKKAEDNKIISYENIQVDKSSEKKNTSERSLTKAKEIENGSVTNSSNIQKNTTTEKKILYQVQFLQ